MHFCVQRTRAAVTRPAWKPARWAPENSAMFSILRASCLHPAHQARVHPVERGTRDVTPFLLLLRRMREAIRNYAVFLWRCGRSPSWGLAILHVDGVLTVLCLLGLNAYAKQFVQGLYITGMSDEVSWGFTLPTSPSWLGWRCGGHDGDPGLYLQ